MKDVITVISTVGFPIAACVALGWYVSKQLEKFRETVDNNTKAVLELLAYFRKRGE